MDDFDIGSLVRTKSDPANLFKVLSFEWPKPVFGFVGKPTVIIADVTSGFQFRTAPELLELANPTRKQV